MHEFLNVSPGLETWWRGIILFGNNVATYKFALAKSLLELADRNDEKISLEELAEPYSRHIVEHIQKVNKQSTSRSSRFLEACKRCATGETDLEGIRGITTQLGFNNVLGCFSHSEQGRVGRAILR